MKGVALLLVVLGIVGLVLGGIGYNRQTTVFQMGDIKATATEHRTIPIAPILGAISLIGGIVLFVVERRGSRLS
ncbi:MAG: DUF3185 domain-containing protein [Candidatus Aminicenantes bacterium RBG_16_66_30]